MMKARKRAAMMILAFALAWGTGLVAYASADAVLMSDETTKSTLCVGNTNGCFYWWGNVASISKYNVQFVMYGGNNSGNCNSEIKKSVYSPDSTFNVTRVSASTSKYNVGKVTMYGNTVDNPKKECIAGAGISSSN